jgi:hypothetical protein
MTIVIKRIESFDVFTIVQGRCRSKRPARPPLSGRVSRKRGGDPVLERQYLRDDASSRSVRVLGQHNVKEERVLYAATDQVPDEAGRDALARRIQRS